MTGAKQNDTPEIKPPEWLVHTAEKRNELEQLNDMERKAVLLRGDEIREEYGLNSPMSIIGLLYLGA